MGWFIVERESHEETEFRSKKMRTSDLDDANQIERVESRAQLIDMIPTFLIRV